MKKLLLSLMLLLMFMPFMGKAQSASLNLTTAKFSYKVGDVFTIKVSVVSGGNTLQVARAKITYPADLLTAQAFTLGSLFPQKSPGESIGNGVINSGGYLLGAGTTANGILGTATFKVKKAGSATITLINGSRLITPDGQDIYGGGNSLNLTLNETTTKKDEATSATSATTKESRIITPVISSSTHNGDKWSQQKLAAFTWTAPADNLGYVINFGQEMLNELSDQVNTTANAKSYSDLTDGIWYFQVKAKFASGFSDIETYTIKIDTTPPQTPLPSIEVVPQANGENTYKISFGAIDQTSGVIGYQIAFDDGNFTAAASPYLLTSAEKNAQIAIIKAIDNADNESQGQINISDFIKQQEDKITLFDIQANAVKRSWLEFYVTIGVIAVIFIVAIILLLVKKRNA